MYVRGGGGSPGPNPELVLLVSRLFLHPVGELIDVMQEGNGQQDLRIVVDIHHFSIGCLFGNDEGAGIMIVGNPLAVALHPDADFERVALRGKNTFHDVVVPVDPPTQQASQ